MAKVWIGNFKGPPGKDGLQGPDGPEGPQGVQGPKGDTGDPDAGTATNLLCNWYFASPVNQRGKTAYTGPDYTIDRWCGHNEDFHVTLVDNGIELRNTIEYDNLTFYQRIGRLDQLRGKTVTLSILDTNGTLMTDTGLIPADYNEAEDGLLVDGFYVGDAGWCDLWLSYGLVQFRVVLYPKKSTQLLAAKLELGDHQTLAHQEGDKWVLNEIPDPALELLRCQRYYLRLTSGEKNVILATQNGQGARFYIPTPAPMRANPAFHIKGEVFLPSDATLDATGTARAGENGVSFWVEDNSGYDETADQLWPAHLEQSDDFLELNAEL